MPEFSDTTTGIVEQAAQHGQNGYPGTNIVTTSPMTYNGQTNDGFGYYLFEDWGRARIGAGLRFWSKYPTGGATNHPMANHWIYDFFQGSVWPAKFRSRWIDRVMVAGDCAPPNNPVVRYGYPDPINVMARPGTNPPANPDRAYQITALNSGTPNVGWLFVHQGAGQITIAVDSSYVDGGRPIHMGLYDCEFVDAASPAGLGNLWSETLTRNI